MKMKEKLQKTLIIGWSDICLAGCRAILGSTSESVKLHLNHPSVDDNLQKSFIKYEEIELPSVSKTDYKQEQVSLVAITSSLNNGIAAHIFDKILDLCNSCDVKELIIVAALQMTSKSVSDSEICQVAINCSEVGTIKSLPQDVLIKDHVLNLLIQFLQVEGIPVRCFITQGYKIKPGKPNEKDGSKQSIKNLQNTLHTLYNIEFDEEKTDRLEYAEVHERSTSNMMYL